MRADTGLIADTLSGSLARTVSPAVPGVVRRSLGAQAAAVGSDLVALTALVFCIPFAILILGSPIALLAQLVLWMARLL